MKLVSIIIPTYDLSNYTIPCLTALFENTEYRPLELVWVDNGSSKAHRDLVKAFLDKYCTWPLTKVLIPVNLGWVGGCWAGYEKAQGNYIVLLNNDTLPTQGWLEAMIEALEKDEQLGIVGCVSSLGWQGIANLKSKWPELAEAPEDIELVPEWLQEHCQGQVRYVPGMVAFFAATLRQAMLDQIGFLDKQLGLGLGDDDDLCWRARVRGWKVGVALSSFVRHDHHRTTFEYLAEQEGIDYRAIQQHNMAFIRWKQQGGGGMTEFGTVYKYLGKDGYPFDPDIPARDLTYADVAWLELERNITKEHILRSGIYLEVREVEEDALFGPSPFCGAPKADGTRCQRKVAEWGMRCYQHPEEEEEEESYELKEESEADKLPFDDGPKFNGEEFDEESEAEELSLEEEYQE